jgi:APA family basic amino acid/polyamine antiporter
MIGLIGPSSMLMCREYQRAQCVTSSWQDAHVTSQRVLGLPGAVILGLGSMLGAGVFVAFAPAAASAGSGLLISLVIAALVAFCNALSSARLARLYPVAGGTYAYGRERLGPFWGYLAGWAFVVGKIASSAAIALTVGAYLWPELAHPVAVAAVVVVTALDIAGLRKSLVVTAAIVAVVVATIGAVVAVGLSSPTTDAAAALPADGLDPLGVLTGAGLLFFAFAGYARIATLGEEVRDPERTIPRAIPIALGIVLVLYAALAVTLLAVLGSSLAGSPAPLADAARAAGALWLVPVVRVVAGLAALGSLLALLLGISRTTMAMARNGDVPRGLAAQHPRTGVPHVATLAIGVVVAVLAAVADLRGAIGFSSFGVLLYYAIANASALTLRERPVLPILGLVGCLVLAATLPWQSSVAGAVVLAVGAAAYGVRTLARRE